MKTPNTTETAATLFKEAEQLIETKLEYARLTVTDKSAALSGSLIFAVAAGLLAAGLILAASFAIAVFISEKTGSRPYGFFAVGGFYLLLLLIIAFFRRRLIESPIANALIHKLA